MRHDATSVSACKQLRAAPFQFRAPDNISGNQLLGALFCGGCETLLRRRLDQSELRIGQVRAVQHGENGSRLDLLAFKDQQLQDASCHRRADMRDPARVRLNVRSHLKSSAHLGHLRRAYLQVGGNRRRHRYFVGIAMLRWRALHLLRLASCQPEQECRNQNQRERSGEPGAGGA